ncbi:MAG: AAA domain-containing protein [Hyphomicrobiales bacterium]
MVSLAERVAAVQQTWRPELFARDVEALAQGFEPGAGNPIGAFFAGLFNGSYKSAAKEAKALRTGPASARAMLGELRAAAALQGEWNRLAPGVPVPALADVAALAAAAQALSGTVDGLAPRLGGAALRTLSPAAFETTVNNLAADSLTPDRIPRLLEIEAAIEQAGAGAIIAELRRVQPPTELWTEVFRYAHLASLLERAQEHDSGIAGFNGRVHDRAVAEFCDLDRQRLKVAVARVRRAHAGRAVEAMNQFPEQDALVRKEANKKSRHLPLRKLLAQAPDVLTSLCPCWMASPLTVAQLLDTGRRYFDVVIFDEASQVLPEDAACSLVRARHAIVAGDSKQLPPTTFFAAGTDDDAFVGDGDDQVAGFESLLDMLRAFLEPWTLRWHYRSRDETLIAFSNRFIYDGQLVTFPGPGGPPVVRHELVAATPDAAENDELDSVAAEVDRVVQLVIEHAETRPDETLGVIAMGIRHANRVEDALDLALQSRPDLDAFFDQSKDERFFVKNLERVQGDERDAIILTVGYGKDRNGRLPYRFGPLLSEGGERRLNVAVTRARRRVTLVSSFTHHDMDPGRSDARGIQLLREYLAYAASGGHEEAGGASGNAAAATAFEKDVREVLEARGLQLVPHWGASTYRVDFAVRHPEDPERFVLAIECDGPNYQRVPTARDRDRLREQVLAGLGWRYHRIWSTDWYLRKEEEADRAVRAYQEALAEAESPAPSVAAAPAASAPAAAVAPPPDSGRGPRPRVRRGKAIDEYTQRELITLVQWIVSDGRMRTNEELIDEMVDELGFSRRGSRIEAAIRWAIEAAGV